MPRRPMPPDPPDFPLALEAIKTALNNGREILVDEYIEFLERRRNFRVSRTHTLVGMYPDGSFYYRIKGKAGADLLEHPVALKNREQLRKYYVSLSAVFRRPPSSRVGVLAKQAKARQLVLAIYALADQNAHRGRYKADFIAKRLKISPKYVREVLRKRTEREGGDS